MNEHFWRSNKDPPFFDWFGVFLSYVYLRV